MEHPIRRRQWTRAEYDRLIEIGVFRPGGPVELPGGELIAGEPSSGLHNTAIYLAEEASRKTLGPEWLIRTRVPIALDAKSRPEPHVAVAQGTPGQ